MPKKKLDDLVKISWSKSKSTSGVNYVKWLKDKIEIKEGVLNRTAIRKGHKQETWTPARSPRKEAEEDCLRGDEEHQEKQS